MSSIERSLAGPVLSFHLEDQLAELREEDGYRRGGRSGRTLAKSGRLRLVLVAMAEGNVIHTHQADSPLTLHVLEGAISFRTGEEEHDLGQGDVLFFGPGDAHDVTAHGPTALLLTLSAIGDDFRD